MNSNTQSKQHPIVEAESVSFQYTEEFLVLDNITFQIQQGDYVGLLGPNGSGKTTLIRLLLGLEKPSQGSIKLFGESVTTFKERHWIGYVPQRASQTEWQFPATVREVVETGRTARLGLCRRMKWEDEKAVNEAMETTQVKRFEHRLINNLSGGERQRVFIARALAAEPKMLILDEPTVGVDIGSQEVFYAFIKELNEKHDITIVFVSHDIDVITHEAKSILCLNKQLVCHVDSKDFISQGHLEKLYGTKQKFILHGH